MTAEDYSRAIGYYDQLLKHYPNVPEANEVRVLRGIAELCLAEKKATASGDWTPACEVAQAQVKALPKERADPDVLQKFSIALARIGEGLAQQAEGHPDTASVDRVQSVVNLLESDVPEGNRPTKMLDGIKDILKLCKQKVEGGRELDRTVDEIREAVAAATSRRLTRPIARLSARIPN